MIRKLQCIILLSSTTPLIIVSAIGIVDKALISIDKDKSQCATLADLADKYSNEYELNFANGGDQNNNSIPEVRICKEKGIGLLDFLSQNKIMSSKSEARRLIKSNGFKINDVLQNNEKKILKVDDFKDKILKISCGKKRHYLVKLI